MNDNDIIELFWQRDESAITETDLKYGKYLFVIADNIVHDKLDCEECLQDTYLGAWNSIPPTKPNIFKAFLTTIMRRVAVNRYNLHMRKKSIPSQMTISLQELEDTLASDDEVIHEYDAAQLGRVISDYLRTLSKRKQYIFMSRYYVAEPIDTIADDLNISRSMVNKELSSIRNGLKEKLESEGYLL